MLDYLVEEVLQQQSESVQTFLLRTSILDRLCGPLCDAVLLDSVRFRARNPGISRTRQPVHRPPGQRAALVPLSPSLCGFAAAATAPEQRLVDRGCGEGVAELHIRASQWYEDNGLEIEAFQHAAAANDVERAERLIEGAGDAPALSRRGGPGTELAGVAADDGAGCQALVVGDVCLGVAVWPANMTGVEEKLQAAEAALQGAEPDDKTRDLIGQIAAIRATLALTQLRGRNHHCPVAPRPGVSAPRQPACPHCHDYGRWGMPTSFRETVPRPAGPIPKPYPSARRLGISSITIVATHRPGSSTGSRKPAVSGGRDLPARPATGR